MLDEDLMPPDPPPYPWGSAVGIVIHPDPRISPPGLRPGDRVNIMGMLQTPDTPFDPKRDRIINPDEPILRELAEPKRKE